MKTVSYYSDLSVPDNNFHREDCFLQVNCAGRAVFGYRPIANSVRQDYYLMLFLKGEMAVEKPAIGRHLLPGDLLIFDRNTPFTYHALSEGVTYYWVHFTGGEAAKLLADCGLTPNCPLPLSEAVQEKATARFERLFDAFARTDALGILERSSRLLSLLVALGRGVAEEGRSRLNDPRIARSTSYIHEHIAAPLSIPELASLEFMSPGHYREIFHRVTGLAPLDYIVNLRLNIACDLLRSTAAAVSEIAAAVGYPDPRYFSRLFTSRMGLSPTLYRRTGTEREE